MSVAAPNRRKLLDECRETVVLRMAEVVHDALDRMGEHLADEAVQCIGAEQRQALLEALSVVREHRLEIEARFRRAFADVFERRMVGDAQPAPAAGPPAGGLSLVADDVLDDRIEVERLAHRAHARLDPDEVLGIRARLGALVERGWFDEGAHPASPQAVFEALKAALADVAPHAEVKRALLDAFEPHVSANLNGIYRRVNQQLVDHQILPRIRLVAAPQRAAAPSMSAPPAALGSGRFEPQAAVVGAQAGLPSPAASGDTAGPRAGLGASASGQAGAALEAALLRLAHGQPSARLSAARVLSDPDLFGAAGVPLPAPHAPLLDALSSLQAHSALSRADAADELLSGAGLFELLAEQAREQGSPLDRITVEVVSAVFGYIDSDQRLPDAVRHQLMRLQVVAVKAALIDRTFFARRQHPMRRLIDRVCEIGADPDFGMAAGSPLLAGLAQAIDRIMADFDRDLAVFEQALAGIEHLAQAETERRTQWLAAQTAQAERQDRLSAAREQAAAQVALRLQADVEAPDFVRAFLSGRWVDVLAASRGETEQPSPAWDETLRVVEDLLWSVAPKLPSEVVQLAQLLPGLIAALMRGLKRIGLPDDERQAFFDALLAAHTQAIAAAKTGPTPLRREAVSHGALRENVAAAAAAGGPAPGAAGGGATLRGTDAAAAAGVAVTGIVGAGSASRADAPDAHPTPCAADPAPLEALRRGDRIELTGDDGLPRRYRLAWISPTRRLFVLSRYPQEARSLDRAALAGLFERGQARVVQPEASMLDRAIVAATREPALSLV